MAGKRIVAGVAGVWVVFALALSGALAGRARAQDGSLRTRAQVAQAKSSIASLTMAVTSHYSKTGRFPGAGAGAAKDDPPMLFRALYVGDPKQGGDGTGELADWPTEDIGLWTGAWKAAGEEYERADEPDVLGDPNEWKPMVFLDPWGRPFHYVEWESLPPAERKLGDRLVAGETQRYAIWSNGPNGENEWGEGDDIASWKP